MYDPSYLGKIINILQILKGGCKLLTSTAYINVNLQTHTHTHWTLWHKASCYSVALITGQSWKNYLPDSSRCGWCQLDYWNKMEENLIPWIWSSLTTQGHGHIMTFKEEESACCLVLKQSQGLFLFHWLSLHYSLLNALPALYLCGNLIK